MKKREGGSRQSVVLFHSFQASCFIGLENCCEGGGEGENTDIPVKHIYWGEEKIYILETTFMLEMQPPISSNLVCQRKRKHRNACFAECISREGRQQRLMVGAWKAIWVRAFIPPHFSFDFNNGSKLKTKTQK